MPDTVDLHQHNTMFSYATVHSALYSDGKCLNARGIHLLLCLECPWFVEPYMSNPENQDLSKIYEGLKSLARLQRSRIFAKKGMGTCSIVHEAYLKLYDSQSASIKNTNDFLLLASSTMRSVLIDNARHWMREKRGGKLSDLPLDHVDLVSAQRSDELLELDKALLELSKENSRLADVVTCRFFGGLSIAETASALDVSAATVKRDWILARTLLYQTLEHDEQDK